MTLKDKLKFWLALNNYIEMIVHDTSLLSLPNAMEDSLDYLKAFGGTEQRNLPNEYTELEYIESTGTQYIDTGIIATNWDWSVEFEMSVPQAGDMFFGAGRGLWSSAHWGAQFGLANSSGNANWGAGSGGMNVVISNLGVRTNTFYNYKMTKEGLYVNGELKSKNTATESFSNSDLSLWICKTNNSGTSGYNRSASSWKYVRIYNADTALVFNGVPAKNPDGKIGMYDTVSGTFFTNAGTDTFIAGPNIVPTPDAPMDIVSNNGVLKARHASGLPLGYTLLEYIEAASGSYIDTRITPTINAKADVKFAPTQTSATGYWGARSDPNRFCCTTFSSGTKFGIGMTNNTWPANRTPITLESIYDCVVANGYASVNGAEYTETPVESFGNAGKFYLGRIGAAKYYKCKLWENNVLVFDGIPAKNANDVIGMYDLVSGQFFTNQGTGDFVAGDPVSDPVEIYTDGTVETIKDSLNNTATAEMLLKVGNYQDVQSIIDGTVTRNVKAIVLTGTEKWSPSTTYSNVYTAGVAVGKPSGGIAPICNYFAGYSTYISMAANDYGILGSSAATIAIKNKDCVDVTAFTTWLADQYAAGTPVIVVYPLATPTTESVAGQTLQVQAGNNTLQITQASLNNLELEAKYNSVP